ncbi:MAG: response regulator [Solirubrobacteraceae bacterium]
MSIEPIPAASVTSHGHPGTRIAVLLVDDHPAVRIGARQLIDDQPDMGVVPEARSAEEALRRRNVPVDVAVVDTTWVTAHPCSVTYRRAQRIEQPPHVLVYSAFADNALAVMALIAGADGVLDRREPRAGAVRGDPWARPWQAAPTSGQVIAGACAAFTAGAERPGDFRHAPSWSAARCDRRAAGDMTS